MVSATVKQLEIEKEVQRKRILRLAEQLVADAILCGIVVEIRTVPLPPPAIPRMGGYIMEASARLSNPTYRAIDALKRSTENGN